MSNFSIPVDRLSELAGAVCNNEAAPGDLLELDALLTDNSAARRRYMEYCRIHAALRLELRANRAAQKVRRQIDGDSAPLPYGIVHNTPQNATGYTLHSWSLAYLVATVFFAVGLFVGSFIHISRLNVQDNGPQRLVGAPPLEMVGQITAFADCHGRQWSAASAQWSNISKSKDLSPKTIFLGDRFHLASGLMEITYDTGAKVILQAPCTYNIDSDRSGYLAVGKLTAKVEKGSGARGPGAGNANHSPLSPLPSPLFAVRTPTAVVTDLGTEFGVEVEQSGATRSHVFQGKVELRENSRELTTPGASPLILQAGESACVKRGRNNKVAIAREPGQPDRFVRRIPSSVITHPSALSKSSRTPDPRPLTPLFHLTDLGTLGGKLSRANAINPGGQVVGDAINAVGERHAFLYFNGRMHDLGTLDGRVSCAHAVNAIGQVAGYSGDSQTDCRAFVYADGKMKPLDTLGGTRACAFGINDAGHIVGSARTARGVDHAFLYSDAEGITDLGALLGEKTKSWAYSVNNAGQAVGYRQVGKKSTRAFIYTPGMGVKDLGALDGKPLVAFRINNAGQVVGLYSRDGGPRAFLYNGGATITDLGAFAGPSGFVLDVNNMGQIVGCVQGKRHGAATMYSFILIDGHMVDLASRIHDAADWSMLRASAINDAGQIVGHGRAPDGQTRAFMLSPVQGKKRGSRPGTRG